MARSLGITAAACLGALVLVGASGAQDAERPEILNVAFPERLTAGQPATARITFRAPRGNVVAVIQILEDLDGARRVTSQREVGVVAAAFGFEEGDLLLPIKFHGAGIGGVGRDTGPEERGVQPADRRAAGERSRAHVHRSGAVTPVDGGASG